MDTREKLKDFVKQKTSEYESTLSTEYRSSKWYEKPSITEVFGEEIGSLIKKAIYDLDPESVFPFRYVIQSERDYFSVFDEMARNYGSGWYDEDTNRIRSGYKEECRVCTNLRNIFAEAVSEKEIPLYTYFEGCEYAVK